MSSPVALFEPSGHFFLSLSVDSRLRLFRSANNELLFEWVPEGHLTQNFSCLAVSQSSSSPASSSSSPASSRGFAAVGSANGTLFLIDLTAGKLVRQIPKAHGGEITSLCFSPSSSSSSSSFSSSFLYSTGADGNLKSWRLSQLLDSTSSLSSPPLYSSSHHALFSLSVSPCGSFLALSSDVSIFLFETATFQVLKRFLGNFNKKTIVRFSPDSKYLLSGSDDRFLNLWPVSVDEKEEKERKSKKEKSKKKENDEKVEKRPFHTFTLPSAPKDFQFNPFSPSFSLDVVALVDHLELHIFSFSASSSLSSTSSAVISTPLQINSNERIRKARALQAEKGSLAKKKSAPVLSSAAASTVMEEENQYMGTVLAFSFASKEALLLARGERAQPQISRVSYREEKKEEEEEEKGKKKSTGKIKPSFVLDEYSVEQIIQKSNSVLDDTKKRKLQQNDKQTVLSAAEMAPANAPKKAKVSTAAVSSSSAASASAQEQQTSEALSLTLAERIAELEKQAGLHAQTSFAELSKSFKRSQEEDDEEDGKRKDAPQANSLQTLLTQALHSNDETLFEYCLGLSSSAAVKQASQPLSFSASSSPLPDNLIVRTLLKLPSAYIFPLLAKLVGKFIAKPARALVLIQWIRLVFFCHLSFLLGFGGDLNQLLHQLVSSIDARLSSYKRLLKLNGRLELILVQMNQFQRKKERMLEDDQLNRGNTRNIFRDGDEYVPEKEQEGEDEEELEQEEKEEEQEEEEEEEEEEEAEEEEEEEEEDESEEDEQEQKFLNGKHDKKKALPAVLAPVKRQNPKSKSKKIAQQDDEDDLVSSQPFHTPSEFSEDDDEDDD